MSCKPTGRRAPVGGGAALLGARAADLREPAVAQIVTMPRRVQTGVDLNEFSAARLALYPPVGGVAESVTDTAVAVEQPKALAR